MTRGSIHILFGRSILKEIGVSANFKRGEEVSLVRSKTVNLIVNYDTWTIIWSNSGCLQCLLNAERGPQGVIPPHSVVKDSKNLVGQAASSTLLRTKCRLFSPLKNRYCKTDEEAY